MLKNSGLWDEYLGGGEEVPSPSTCALSYPENDNMASKKD